MGPIPNPPAEFKMSMEADIYPMNAEEKADKIVSPEAAIDMVALMPIDDAQKKAMRARIRRWVKILEDRGYRLP